MSPGDPRSGSSVADERQAFLSRSWRVLADPLDADRLLEGVLDLAVPALADWAILYLVEAGEVRRAHSVHRDPDAHARLRKLQDAHPIDLRDDRHPIARVLRTGEPRLVPRIDASVRREIDPELRHEQDLDLLEFRSELTVPLRRGDAILGALALATTGASSREYGHDDVAFLEEVAARVALALDNARHFEAERQARRDAEHALVALSEARRQLAQTERLAAMGTLVSGVAHEIRTPLTYMVNNVSILDNRLERAEREGSAEVAALAGEARPLLAAALEGAQRINSLVLDLRRFMRAKAPLAETAPLGHVLDEALRLFEATHRDRAVVDVDVEPTPEVRVDRTQLQQVLLNLLENAADASPAGAPLRVEVRATRDGARVSVLDRGAGVPPEAAPHLFEPFFTTKPEGTGLGLAIARRIVEEHGGHLDFSPRDGGGTVFTVELPAHPG